ncbi:hypothetical protein KC19_8G030200 [Ceratodon purpureus]|uniref:Uncharacterized protein n=1 Tax=Ceratodon purpureus TaxID=3225 RepID=A0A8T0GZ72_CERPU|nr:hypothetical protein KC19_8G030200 [Ceratodon purpureus]
MLHTASITRHLQALPTTDELAAKLASGVPCSRSTVLQRCGAASHILEN